MLPTNFTACGGIIMMVERIRDEKDRRVVNIVSTKKAKDFVAEEKELIEYYLKEVYSTGNIVRFH